MGCLWFYEFIFINQSSNMEHSFDTPNTSGSSAATKLTLFFHSVVQSGSTFVVIVVIGASKAKIGRLSSRVLARLA